MNKKDELDEKLNRFKILTDTREQIPFKFPNTKVCCLPYGDYTVEYDGKSYIDQIVIERKGGIGELFGFSGTGRERFVRELEKMEGVKYKYILIEGDYLSIVNNQPPGIMPASTVYATIFSFMIKHNITPLFFNNHQNCRSALYIIFKFFVKYEILGIK